LLNLQMTGFQIDVVKGRDWRGLSVFCGHVAHVI